MSSGHKRNKPKPSATPHPPPLIVPGGVQRSDQWAQFRTLNFYLIVFEAPLIMFRRSCFDVLHSPNSVSDMGFSMRFDLEQSFCVGPIRCPACGPAYWARLACSCICMSTMNFASTCIGTFISTCTCTSSSTFISTCMIASGVFEMNLEFIRCTEHSVSKV